MTDVAAVEGAVEQLGWLWHLGVVEFVELSHDLLGGNGVTAHANSGCGLKQRCPESNGRIAGSVWTQRESSAALVVEIKHLADW